MSDYPSDLRYTREHEWVRPEGNRWRIGITSFAAKELGEVVFVELPEVDRSVSQGDELGTIESVKAVSELFAPVGGKVVAVNEALTSEPELLNDDPYGEGWLVEIEPSQKSELDELLTSAQYTEFTAKGE